jgi:hypothetical protein
MIKKKDQLFHLIKSLTKEEKRDFKLYVNKYSSARENNYLKLFNAMDKHEVYDEAAIKRQFSNEAFIKQLTVTKYYLLNLIIKSLQNFHYDDSKNLKVLSFHHQIEILYRKGQYEICRQIVKKGIEICSENELFLPWIGFLRWEIILINKMDLAEYKTSLAKYLEDTSKLLTWYEITTQGNHLTNQVQIFSLNISTFGSYSNHYQLLIKNIEELISKTDVALLPLKTRLNLYIPLAISYLIISDYRNSFEIYLLIYEDLKREYIKKGLHEQYVDTLTGLIYTGGAANNTAFVLRAIEELKNIPEINPYIKFRKSEGLAFYPLFTAALSGNYYHGLTAIEIVESFLSEHSDQLTPVQFIYAYYYAAYIHFGGGNNAMALKYLRKTDEHLSRELLPNIRLGMKIMELAVFYEQHKFELVESRLRSLQRHLQKENKVKPYFKSLVRFFFKITSTDPESEAVQESYNRFLSELLELKHGEQVVLFIHFDMISWLQSHIEKCTLGEKLQKNAARLFLQETSGEPMAV